MLSGVVWGRASVMQINNRIIDDICKQTQWLAGLASRLITCNALYKTSALRVSTVRFSMTLIPKQWLCPYWSSLRSVMLSTGKRRPLGVRKVGSALAFSTATRPPSESVTLPFSKLVSRAVTVYSIKIRKSGQKFTAVSPTVSGSSLCLWKW